MKPAEARGRLIERGDEIGVEIVFFNARNRGIKPPPEFVSGQDEGTALAKAISLLKKKLKTVQSDSVKL